MNSIQRDIFRAIHENKWLRIEYKNKKEETTKYWIGIKTINPKNKTMRVEGLHLAQYTTMELDIYVESILSSYIIEGSYFETDDSLKEDIENNPFKYTSLFHHVSNLKILNYYTECNKLDCVPYKTEYSLINHFDGDCIQNGDYYLNDLQFQEIVKNFQYNSQNRSSNKKIKQLALNVLSIPMKEGLYVLAYRELKLDVIGHRLKPADEVTICTEFTIDGTAQSIRKFLDADDYELLNDFEANAELIKDRITESNNRIKGVDDMPYLIAIGRDIILDLHKEYEAITEMYEKDKVSVPIQAFFGDLIKESSGRKVCPLALLNKKINLDQMLAIHNAMKRHLAYIQGPPGTGKTNTIVNTIVTAFFNENTVLFTAYNNHPIDQVCEKLQHISNDKKGTIPFPIIRLGNNDKVLEALDYMKELYENTQNISIFDSTLKKWKSERIERTNQLTAMLQNYEERLELLETREAIKRLMDSNRHLTFQTQLQGVQLAKVEEKLKETEGITDEEALKLVLEDEDAFRQFLYYASAKCIKRMQEAKYKDLLQIIYMKDPDDKVTAFNKYIKNNDNLKKFQRIFPIIATTTISANKLGEAGALFDMTIMDEASQGNAAMSLVPIIRGESLMLVGDPQQLNPVILLNPIDNTKLRKMYQITDEYDYIKNSIYKVFLACDSVSREILLSHHYRCNEKIIQFNNKKYYNNKLKVCSKSKSEMPLTFVNIPANQTHYKNTAPMEVEEIIKYASLNKDKNIGVITPFTNQRELINQQLKEEGLGNVSCGTVHAFQGDEKDVVLFSLALTDKTGQGTYEWLKNNKELINVAVSRAKEQLVILSSKKELDRLHGSSEDDDLYELVQYVQGNGTTAVTPKTNPSRALGIKPYSTETEQAFLDNLNHALDNVLSVNQKCRVQKEVGIAHVFQDNVNYNDLFYTGRFDFVVYEKQPGTRMEFPILAIELDGKEHQESSKVKERDRKKEEICKEHGFELIRVENTYARRYQHMKDILVRYFTGIK